MLPELKNQNSLFRILIILLIIAVSIYLLQILWQFLANFSDILLMIFLAWLLSFVLEPLVNFTMRIGRLPKLTASFVVYGFFAVFFSVVIFFFTPLVINELQSLSKIIPKFLYPYPQVSHMWNNVIAKSLDIFISLIPSLATILVDFVLMLILSFYFVVDKEKIIRAIYNFAPLSFRKHLKFIQEVVDRTFSSFFRIQLIFALIAGFSTWTVLTAFGIQFAASVSLLAGILTLIPVLGQFLGAIPPAFVVLATHQDTPVEAFLIFIILILIGQIAFNLLGPKLMGNAFKLHPLVIFLSIIVGYKIAGAIGAVLVVPLFAIFVIVVKDLAPYFINPPKESEKV